MYCLKMLAIALELAREDPVYEDVATKFFEHFLYIAGGAQRGRHRRRRAGPAVGRGRRVLLRRPAPRRRREIVPLKVRSLVGLIPLLAVETIEPELLDALPDFRRRMRWFLHNRPDLAGLVASLGGAGRGPSGGCSRSSAATG